MLEGDLRDVGLPSLVQMLCLENREVAVRLSRHGEDGTIYILEGRVVHVEYGPYQGEEAFYKLAWWSEGSFRVCDLDTRPPMTVSLPTEHLLMEAMQRLDESRKDMTGGTEGGGQTLTPEDDAHDQELMEFLVEGLARAERWVASLKSGRLEKKSALDALSEMIACFAKLARDAPGERGAGLPVEKAIAAVSDDYGELRLIKVRGDRILARPALDFCRVRSDDPAVNERFARQLGQGQIALVQHYCAHFARLFHSLPSVEEWIEIYNVFILDLKQAFARVKL